MKEETLQVMEKDLNKTSHVELLKIVVNQKKAELNDLTHKIMLYKNNLRQIEDNCKKTQSDHSLRMAQEKQDLERFKNSKHNEFAQRQEVIEQNERRCNERETNLQEKETTRVKLNEELKTIYNERVELEKIKRMAKLELEGVRILQTKAENIISQASQKEEKANKDLAIAKQLNSSAEQQFSKASEKEKKTSADLENLQKIRTGIAPKFDELEALSKKNEKTLADIKLKEDEINGKIAQNEKMMEGLKVKLEALKAKELEIATKGEEVLRQEIVIKNLKKNG